MTQKVAYLGKEQGFAHRTPGRTALSPFPHFPISGEKWRSPLFTSDITADVKQYFNATERPTDPLLDYAISKTRDRFHLPNNQNDNLNDVFQLDLDIWDKSPGLPWTQIGYKTKGDIKHDPDAVRSVGVFGTWSSMGVL